MAVIEGENDSVSSLAHARSTTARVLKKTWTQIAQAEREMLQAITFGDLVERIKTQGENMYYI